MLTMGSDRYHVLCVGVHVDHTSTAGVVIFVGQKFMQNASSVLIVYQQFTGSIIYMYY